MRMLGVSFWADPALSQRPPTLPLWAPLVPVLLRDVECHHLQGLQALHHPAMALAHPLCLYFQEAVWHAAPEHRLDGLDIEPRWTLWDWVLLFTLKYGRRQGHCILGQGEKASEKKTHVQYGESQLLDHAPGP